MRALTHPGTPTRGWIVTGGYDLGMYPENHITCEWCGVQKIRHVATVTHPDCADTLAVGCECLEKIGRDKALAKPTFQALINRSSRKEKFSLSCSWTSFPDGTCRNRPHGMKMLFVARLHDWGKWSVSHIKDGEKVWIKSPVSAPSLIDILPAAFDHAFPLSIELANIRSN